MIFKWVYSFVRSQSVDLVFGTKAASNANSTGFSKKIKDRETKPLLSATKKYRASSAQNGVYGMRFLASIS